MIGSTNRPNQLWKIGWTEIAGYSWGHFADKYPFFFRVSGSQAVMNTDSPAVQVTFAWTSPCYLMRWYCTRGLTSTLGYGAVQIVVWARTPTLPDDALGFQCALSCQLLGVKSSIWTAFLIASHVAVVAVPYKGKESMQSAWKMQLRAALASAGLVEKSLKRCWILKTGKGKKEK